MLYWPTIWTLRVLFRLLTRFQVEGREHIPRLGPFLLVSNHISHFDPPVHSAACPRAINWMGSDILFRKRWARFYFESVRVIEVKQYEADQRALRDAIRRVKSGRCVGLYPEGGIRAGDQSLLGSQGHLYEGAFMIAALARAPIVPALLIGSDRLYNPSSLWRRPPIWVRYGRPIPVEGSGRGEIERLRQATLEAIRGLARELRETGQLREEDWPQTPQQRNPGLSAREVKN